MWCISAHIKSALSLATFQPPLVAELHEVLPICLYCLVYRKPQRNQYKSPTNNSQCNPSIFMMSKRVGVQADGLITKCDRVVTGLTSTIMELMDHKRRASTDAAIERVMGYNFDLTTTINIVSHAANLTK